MTYDLDHIVRTICSVLLFLGDWQFSLNVLNFSHSVANNNISREMITLVHNAVRYIYTHLLQLLWGNFHYIDGTIITIYSSAPLTQSDYFINQIILPSPVTYLSHCTLCQILRTTPWQIQDRCSLWGRAKQALIFIPTILRIIIIITISNQIRKRKVLGPPTLSITLASLLASIPSATLIVKMDIQVASLLLLSFFWSPSSRWSLLSTISLTTDNNAFKW